jgi:hypothetical protein
MGQGGKTFHPFYERLAAPFPGYIIGELVVSMGLGLVFLAAHYAAIGAEIFRDWSWFLAPLITTAMLALYYATYTLRGLLPEMTLRLRPRADRNGHDGAEKHDSDCTFMQPLNETLSDWKFIRAGVFFGLVNCLMGDVFGLLYATDSAKATILSGFFLAGFVCGMAAWGIYGVTVTVAAFAREAKPGLDYAAPDHCGGVQFVGEGLLVFSSVTLLVGVMISVFIHEFKWDHRMLGWVVALQWAWIVFPYVLSLVVLIGPAVPLNDALRQYKVEMEAEQLRTSDAIRRQLAAEPPDSAKRKDLRDEYAYQQNIRKDLHAMGTWPHGMSANLKYLGIFAANMFASASSAFSLFDKLK